MPRNIEKDDIGPFLLDLMKKSEEWRALKIVVLGNGRIGKTTLIKAVKGILNLSSSEV